MLTLITAFWQSSWPHCIFDSLSTTLENGSLIYDGQQLTDVCRIKFTSQALFLRDIPEDVFYQRPQSRYFSLAVACIGSLLNGDPEKQSSSLCLASLWLLLAQLEVDNREARRVELMKAVSVLHLTLKGKIYELIPFLLQLAVDPSRNVWSADF